MEEPGRRLDILPILEGDISRQWNHTVENQSSCNIDSNGLGFWKIMASQYRCKSSLTMATTDCIGPPGRIRADEAAWKSFFIHIATIVIGLLIAISLE
jgi:hypothetical protein